MSRKRNRDGDGIINPTSTDIDLALHSGQVAVYGLETIRRIFATNVLISGLQGLGGEIAKNLILAGVKSITLHDEGCVELWDLSSSFLFSEDDVRVNRALASLRNLQELNKNVTVNTLTEKLTKENLSQFQVVVFTDISLQEAKEFDEYCHDHKPPIAFIKAEVRGLFGSVFCDFGPDFTVVDVDGEEPHKGILTSVTKSSQAVVNCANSERLELQDGDLVVFSGIQGMTELNDGIERSIKNVGRNSFTLDEDTTNYEAYDKGGIVTQVKQSKKLCFKPLREALKNPGNFLSMESSTSARPSLMHLAFQALDEFRAELSRFPVAGCVNDAEKLISIFNRFNDSCSDKKIDEFDRKLLRDFAFGAKAVLSPMAAVVGGIVGQEVLKACSGKFHPIFQFFYFDSVESLPTGTLNSFDVMPMNSRYDAQISVFGSKLQKKLEEANVFIVGAGSLGCEFLKNVALMGVSSEDQAELTVTDDDLIEKGNLSTQFLFRGCNVGQAKSSTAANAVTSLINPHLLLQIKAYQKRASSETENVFNERFWKNLDVVISAVDNVEARLYIDERCVQFEKPLLESGTLGTKCSTQMVIPHLTENYGASYDPPEKQPLMMDFETSDDELFFPENIDDCVSVARNEFDGLLDQTPSEVMKLLDNTEDINFLKDCHFDQLVGMLKRIIGCLDENRCKSFDDCIKWARLRFEDYFVNRIKQLTLTYPKDAVRMDRVRIWSAPHQFPHPLQFSIHDQSHLLFVKAAAVLQAQTYDIQKPDWIESQDELADKVGKIIVPEFEPIAPVRFMDTEDIVSEEDDREKVVLELLQRLVNCSETLPEDFKMFPVHFDKGELTGNGLMRVQESCFIDPLFCLVHLDIKDDDNHLEMIIRFANLWARNYGFPEVDKLKAKLIAGGIKPALGTSSAIASGLVCLELYKVLDGGHKREDYRNTFSNLALPFFTMAEPLPPKVTKYHDMSWTVWDRMTIKGNPTVKDLVEFLRDRKFIVSHVYCGPATLYHSSNPSHKRRMEMKLVDIVRNTSKVKLPLDRKYFDISVHLQGEIAISRCSIYFT